MAELMIIGYEGITTAVQAMEDVERLEREIRDPGGCGGGHHPDETVWSIGDTIPTGPRPPWCFSSTGGRSRSETRSSGRGASRSPPWIHPKDLVAFGAASQSEE